jgi:hypothetical protein
MKCLSRIVVAAMLVVAVPAGTAVAQQRLVIVGAVQWVTTNRVQMMTDAGVSVSIDVSRVGQTEYTSLRSGDRLRVIGVVSEDRNRLIAESLEPVGPGGGIWSSFPQAG